MTEPRPSTSASCDIVLRRRLAAPLAAVWRALTEATEVVKWWGPDGFTAPSARMNVAEGRTSSVCMRSPAGEDLYSAWHYTRVVPERRLEYTFNLCDVDGVTVDPTSTARGLARTEWQRYGPRIQRALRAENRAAFRD